MTVPPSVENFYNLNQRSFLYLTFAVLLQKCTLGAIYYTQHHITWSSVSWPLDSACVVFYRWPIATIRLSCTVMEIWSLKDFWGHDLHL